LCWKLEEEQEENGVVENEKIEKLEVGFDAKRKGKTPITLTLRIGMRHGLVELVC
jgi:hypothetical protein